MVKVSVSDTFNVPADTLWKTVSDFGGVKKLAPDMVKSCTVEGKGVGSIRRIVLTAGGVAAERLESFDAKGKSLSYSIIEAPLPVDRYVATMKVKELGKGRSEFTWSCTFEPKGLSDAEAKKTVETMYKGGIASYKKLLGG
ncbi:MAG: SRPBCC family protein [Dehalococcoidia bacterium]|nr:SRPBCC family protein [Dehalococcoidia bacterium]